jgi:RimJ/RimL family protein N-acetyltransferase
MELDMMPVSRNEAVVLETERLSLRKLNLDDTGFIFELLNEPAFVRFIGERGIKTLEDARVYLIKGPLASYERFGFGSWLVQLKTTSEALGMCGLVKRDWLADIDIGYAFFERFWLKGYASESAAAVKAYGMQVLGIKRLVAIADPENIGSIKVLEKIGLKYERLIRLDGDDMDLKLFAVEG